MKSSFVFILSFISALGLVSATTITCNATSLCPLSSPCCSEYGECGTGLNCLGGCDPRYSYNLTACMPMPMMSNFSTTFDNTTESVLDQNTFLGNASEADWVYSGYLDTYNSSALMQMPAESGGTVISSTKYLWYGKVSTTLKTSHDGGVVTAFILFSNVEDEIDFEFVGYNLTAVQSNYYSLGALNYTNGRGADLTDTFEYYHTYTIDWQEDQIEWYIDDVSVRVLKKSDSWNSTSNRYAYPQTPARVQLSLWPGGNSTNAAGTIEWAGGEINWTSSDIQTYGYYYAQVKNVTVEVYDTPSGLSKVGSSSDGDYTSFQYNSTGANSSCIVLTNAKTYLGSLDDSGLNQGNSNSSSSSSSSSKSSSSSNSKSTSTKTSTGSSGTTTGKTTGTTTAATTATTADSTQTGFDQGVNSISTSSHAAGANSNGVTIFGAVILGVLSFLA